MTALTYPEHTYDQIIIGSGSAAAMYLNTLRTYYQTAPASETMPVSILVIGMGDPWAGARGYSKGHYTENINQARQLFEHGTKPKASMDIDPVDRTEWARTNAGIIGAVTQGHSLQAEVSEVIKHGSEKAFLVKTTAGMTFRANKVVIASGAGIETSDREYHMVPAEVKGYIKAHGQSANIMDLDQFQNGAAGSRLGTGKKLAVIGENAGTDAIMEAATRNYSVNDVFWFMPAGTKPGTALTWDIARLNPTFTAEIAGKDKGAMGNEGCVVRTRAVSLSPSGNKIRVTHDGGHVDVDYFVYAKGQRGGGITRATQQDRGIKQVPFVHKSIETKLEPVYDINQRFSNLAGSGGAWEHVLGIQLKGSTANYGVCLVGSAAVQAGRNVEHNYLDAEYRKFQGELLDITTDFQNAASEQFPELYQYNSFQAMTTNPVIQKLSMDNLTVKAKAFAAAVKQRTERASVALTGGSVKDMLARAKQRATYNEKLAKDLCYLFELRVKAAQYYHQLHHSRDRSLGRNPDRPDSLQSAGLKRTLPETVSDGRLLGGMQRNIAAGNQAYNVNHITTHKGNNFLEDQQSIALYVAVHYPNIKDVVANELVCQIVNDRKSKGRGFTPQEMGVWDFKLSEKERQGQRENNRTLGFAYNKYF